MSDKQEVKTKVDYKAVKATKIVNLILGELKIRGGFSDIFPHIDSDIMDELIATLSTLVKEVI